MPTGRRMWGYAMAALGSAGMLVSLWLPWYSFRIPAAAIDQAESLAQQFGTLGPLIRQGAEVARNLGALHLTAWQILHQADIFIAIAAAAAGGLALLACSGRALGAGRFIAVAGAIGLAVAGYRTLSPPGPDSLLHPAWGAWLAVACGVAVLAGGLVAAIEDSEPEWTAPTPAPSWPASEPLAPQPSIWATSGSVPPPPGG